MAIAPPSSRNASFPTTTTGRESAHKGSAKSRSQYPSPDDVAAAGADAQQQIAAAEKTVTDAQAQANAEMDRLAADYDVRMESDIQRRDQALANERLKGYEALRDLQLKQAEELSRLHHEGERALAEMKDYYYGQATQTERAGTQALRDEQMKSGLATKNEHDSNAVDLELAHRDHTAKLDHLRESNDEQEQQFTAASRAEFERHRTSTGLEMRKTKAAFEQKEATVRDQTNEELASLTSSSNRELERMRQDTSMKLDAYSSRQNDPFYRMVDTNADLSETSDGYELRAIIPPHEREHLTVSVNGNVLALSGYRRNEEKLDKEPGRSESTSAFQSFRETFPLPMAVDAHRLTREFEGDELVVRVPKTGRSYEPKPRPPAPARVRLERPEFPKNLPLQAPQDEEDPRITEARERAHPSRPLDNG